MVRQQLVLIQEVLSDENKPLTRFDSLPRVPLAPPSRAGLACCVSKPR
jgi:hypothetical protein